MLNPDLLNIRFSTPFYFTAQRMRVTLSRLAMSPDTPPSTLQMSSLHGFGYTLLQLSELCIVIPTLYTRKQRLPEANSLAQSHAGSCIELGLEYWSLMNE